MLGTAMPQPRSTYRLQLRPDFGFDEAAAVADYLAALGVSHLYASPYLQATPGSTHGYDVVDPSRVNEELGGAAGHDRLCRALGRAGLGQVLDIVPNHMAIAGPENRWWDDVLRNGPASAYAAYFDVDWDPPESKLRDLVLLPILADHYGRELEKGAIRLVHEDGVFRIRYHDHSLPVAPRSLREPLALAAVHPVAGDGAEAAALEELGFLGRAYARLPEPSADLDPASVEARQRDLNVLDRRLRSLVLEEPAVRGAIDAVVGAINGDPDRLDRVVDAQNYRLAYWRIGGEELMYRRFFDITTLAGLRTERPMVFEAVHERVLDWLRDGVLDGVRIDHPDGLRRPAQYFRRLRQAAPAAWIVAEKILMPDEAPPPWPIDGTTGYEVLNDIGALFVDPDGEAPLTALWEELTGDETDVHEQVYRARKDILRDVLAADLHRLANVFVQVCEGRRRYRDFTRTELREALAEVAAAFPVYRTYVEESGSATETDRAVVERAIRTAGGRRPDLDPELLRFLRSILVGEVEGDDARALRMRFQQFTGPVAAKGEEDTAFYRYLRFVALNEVGGDPGRWGLEPAAFHERSRSRGRDWPAAMTSLSTHDTKRSEDVRARLFTLSEIPDRWRDTVLRWRAVNAEAWSDAVAPDPVMEYLLYQTAVGAWPIGPDRLIAYMEKASREAKLRTSWTEPDQAYDEALAGFVARLMEGPWVADLAGFVEPLIGPGRVVSLAQKLVQLTAPGVPDIYQGTELWDLSLVDPDNRRPVDFQVRRGMLHQLTGSDGQGMTPEAVLKDMDGGLPKLWVVHRALEVRAERAHAFGLGAGYDPLRVGGAGAGHLVGFVRGGEVAVVVPRLVVRLAREGGWRDTAVELPAGTWANELTGEAVEGGRLEAGELLGRFPVALLVRRGGE
jgi:(1->4)-alpha-D-glucan 1-alpha-D-glucosylmutase